MKSYSVIGVPLDGSDTALQSLGCATWLASRLHARLHLLNVGPPLPAGEAAAQLGIPEKYRPLVQLHQMQGEAAPEILAAEQRYGIQMIVITARGAGAAAAERAPSEPLRAVGHVTREVIEKSAGAVLLLPPGYKESLPWRSALVPLSGEPGTDESLTAALRLAHALGLSVTITHVAASAGQPAAATAGLYSDEPYHEYPRMLNEFVARACPMCSAEERSRIEDFRLCHGDIAGELLALIERKRISLLVVGWHGQFATGHAHVLKTLILQVSCPILLFKAAPREPFRLKVGEEA